MGYPPSPPPSVILSLSLQPHSRLIPPHTNTTNTKVFHSNLSLYLINKYFSLLILLNTRLLLLFSISLSLSLYIYIYILYVSFNHSLYLLILPPRNRYSTNFPLYSATSLDKKTIHPNTHVLLTLPTCYPSSSLILFLFLSISSYLKDGGVKKYASS